jgi:hypothetical protein
MTPSPPGLEQIRERDNDNWYESPLLSKQAYIDRRELLRLYDDLLRAHAELEADARRLDFLQQGNYELSFDIERECEKPFVIQRVQGGYNDREWREIGRGETLRAAIDSSLGSK